MARKHSAPAPAPALKQSLGDIRSFFSKDKDDLIFSNDKGVSLPTPDTQTEHDGDTIFVAEAPRAVNESSRKRRRVLSHVESELKPSLFPEEDQTDHSVVVRKQARLTSHCTPPSSVTSARGTVPSSPVISHHETAPSSPKLPVLSLMSLNGRPRRTAARKSYVEHRPDDSDEDMADVSSDRAADDKSEDWGYAAGTESSVGEDDLLNEDGFVSDEDADDLNSYNSAEESDDSNRMASSTRKGARSGRDKSSIAKTYGAKSSSSTNPDSAPHVGNEAAEVAALKRSRAKDRMKNITGGGKGVKKGINQELPPLSDINAIFADLVTRALSMDLRETVTKLKSRTLRVATMCSGTESPLLAFDLIKDSLEVHGVNGLQIDHVFSAEIVPYKQAYIERNFQPPIIFRDIVEITTSEDGKATTAYGAKVTIPGGVDILIAGTSCVDFSGLNRLRKGLDDGGESGDTFNAVLSYAKAYRPRVVLLENVFGAPWNAILDAYEKAGYVATGVLVDTKDFYLPQTRQRGYVFCCLRSALNSNINEDKLREQWKKTMAELKRPASSPTSSFLLPNDDPNVVRTRHMQAKQGLLTDSTREVDWSKCEVRHIKYRSQKELGNARPYTEWQESGTLVLPDYADKAWHKRQVERVWDMQDCSVLRKALPTAGQYDVLFKTRIWDVSQNVDRFTDSAPFGISACLTPSGIFFVTDRGGPLTYPETLALQGIPLDKINFTTETERQVQDLAGNAMSSTVVGSAIIAALIAGLPALLPPQQVEESTVMKKSQQSKISEIVGQQSLEKRLVSANGSEMDVTLLTQKAADSAQKCAACEGQIGTTERPIQQCGDCGHTTCIACGNKPRHNYGPPSDVSRKSPEEFIRHWRARLPMRLVFNCADQVESLLNDRLGSPESGKNSLKRAYVQATCKALETEFRFCRFRRAQYWTVTYEAAFATLELAINPGRLEWKLFAKPDASLAGNKPLRALLQQPIGQVSIVGSQILGDGWDWRIPSNRAFKLDISGSGERLPSWTARLNLPNQEDETVWKYLDIKFAAPPPYDLREDLSGRYELLPKCGTACESLYKRRANSVQESPMFFFLDPTRIGDPNNDTFVFSSDPSRKQYDEIRDVVARLDEPWRPWDQTNASRRITASPDGEWVHDPLTTLQLKETLLDLRSSLNPSASIARDMFAQKCSHATAVVTCGVAGFDETSLTLISADDKPFFDHTSWMMEPLRSSVDYPGWHDLDASMDISCQTCAPLLPQVRWKLVKQMSSVAIRAYEEPASATLYEIALKKRPDVFVVKGSSSGIQIGLNVLSLAQRAYAKLQRLTSQGYTGTSWTLDTKYTDASLKSLPAFHLPSNDQKRYERKVLLEELFTKQQQSLAWMRDQESGQGRRVVIEEAEEALLQHLGWRAEARAQAVTHVRGGILADHPGFGKTVTSLALIKAEFDDHINHASVTGAMRDLHEGQRVGVAAPIKIAATLIICPSHLTNQWHTEVVKFLGPSFAGSRSTIKIQSMTDLEKRNISDFENAKIVLVNQDFLISDRYQKRVAKFSAFPEPSSSRSRDFKAWLDLAIDQVRSHVEVLKQKGKHALEKVINQKYKDHLQDETLRAFARSKRYRGSKYANKSLDDDEDDFPELLKTTMEDKLKATELESCVLFEMFHFNRIIVDEFTYLSPQHYAYITTLDADKRWALSATPALRDAYDVAQMARLIGLRLRIGGVAPELMSVRNIDALRKDMTNAELFETFTSIPSHAMLERTHELAQVFLNDFVRQNILKFGDFEYKDHLVPVTLGLNHRVVYTELSQQLNSQDMRIRKSKKRNGKKQDRDEHIHEAMHDAEIPEEALSKRAALFTGNKSDSCMEIGALQLKRTSESEAAGNALRDAIVKCQKMHAGLKSDELPFETWKKNIEKLDTLGDQETIDSIIGMLDEAEKKHPSNKKSKAVITRKHDEDGDEQDKGPTASGPYNAMMEQISRTNQLAKIKATCETLGCEHVDVSPLAVSSVCGHVMCDDCFKHTADRMGLCQASGCKSQVRDFHLLRGNKIPKAKATTLRGKTVSNATLDFGNKALSVVELLKRIKTRGDQAILFVRYKDQIEHMEKMLVSHDVPCAATHTNPTKAIHDFQVDQSAKNTVIILNAGDESAAGTNLTNANHVIFFSPLLVDSQYQYESQMSQAIGRVRRHGQTKEIFVHRLVALDTIDVDILEHRERRDSVMTEQDDPETAAHKKLASPEGTQLIRDTRSKKFRLVPKSLLLDKQACHGALHNEVMEGRERVRGYEDFSSLVKFSKAYSENNQ
ncbi:hypothetical protein MBLNU459_g4506t1 [Dothideomycetes sp. NU459]